MDAKHVPRETFDWGQSCSRELRFAEAGGRRFMRQGWTVGRAYWTGREWRVPVVRPYTGRDVVGRVGRRALARLRASPAWRLGVVDTVEELSALEAGADALGVPIEAVADALAQAKREPGAAGAVASKLARLLDVPRGTS